MYIYRLAHQQAVHEALQKETGIGQEVLKETMHTLEAKGAQLEHAHADLNDKTSEVKELSERLELSLADLDHSNTAKEDMRRRHEALIDDRESVENDHQAHLDEMMSELKKRQDRTAQLEKELEGTTRRLSNIEQASGDADKLKNDNRSLHTQLSAKENELFEINFEIKGMQSKFKLLETERDELQVCVCMRVCQTPCCNMGAYTPCFVWYTPCFVHIHHVLCVYTMFCVVACVMGRCSEIHMAEESDAHHSHAHS